MPASQLTRQLAAKENTSPFYIHEPVTGLDMTRIAENGTWIKEFFKALGESLTEDEWRVIWKLTLAGRKALIHLNSDSIDGINSAFTQAWELMREYRETGEVT